MPILLSVPYIDNDGDRVSEVYYMDTGLSLAQIQEAWDALAPAIDAVIGGILAPPSVTFTLTNPGGLTVAPNAESETQKRALLNFNTEGIYTHGLYIPTMLQDGFSGDEWDNSGARATLVNLFVNGIAVTGGDAIFQNGQDKKLVSFNKGRKAFHKR